MNFRGWVLPPQETIMEYCLFLECFTERLVCVLHVSTCIHDVLVTRLSTTHPSYTMILKYLNDELLLISGLSRIVHDLLECNHDPLRSTRYHGKFITSAS